MDTSILLPTKPISCGKLADRHSDVINLSVINFLHGSKLQILITSVKNDKTSPWALKVDNQIQTHADSRGARGPLNSCPPSAKDAGAAVSEAGF